MKRFISVICLMATILLFNMTGYSNATMYPHPEVETEITVNEGTQTHKSGREWKTVYGEVISSDMEYGELRYTVYLPENFDSKKEYPFLLYLHGGSIGYHRCDGKTVWEKDLNLYAENFAKGIEDCIIFAPQAPGTSASAATEEKYVYWSGLTGLTVVMSTTDNKTGSSPYLRAVEKMMADYLEKGVSYGDNVYTLDASRLYVVGHSQGGIGAYAILKDCPEMFAGAIIGAGIGDPDSVELWKNTPVRIIHGTNDSSIKYKATEVMAEALKDNPNAEIITIEGADHNIKPYMYGNPNSDEIGENIAWLAKQDRDKAGYIWIAVGGVVIIVAAFAAIWFIKRRKKQTN